MRKFVVVQVRAGAANPAVSMQRHQRRPPCCSTQLDDHHHTAAAALQNKIWAACRVPAQHAVHVVGKGEWIAIECQGLPAPRAHARGATHASRCAQVREEATSLALLSGAPLRVTALGAEATDSARRWALAHAGHIVVATPGRLLAAVAAGALPAARLADQLTARACFIRRRGPV